MSAELACTYAALILHDDGLEITVSPICSPFRVHIGFVCKGSISFWGTVSGMPCPPLLALGGGATGSLHRPRHVWLVFAFFVKDNCRLFYF